MGGRKRRPTARYRPLPTITALPAGAEVFSLQGLLAGGGDSKFRLPTGLRSEEHTSELQSRLHLVCRLLLEKKREPRCSPHFPRYTPQRCPEGLPHPPI